MPTISVIFDTAPPLTSPFVEPASPRTASLEASMPDIFTSDFSRLFLLENRAGPTAVAEYLDFSKAGQPAYPQGDVTVVRNPSSSQRGKFIPVGKIIGEQGNPELPIMIRYRETISKMLKLARNGCDHDLQVHMGTCGTPTDFLGGWEKILVLEAARPTNWGTDSDLGALDDSQRVVVNEEVPFVGEDMYEIVKIVLSELATTETLQEIADIAVCDQVTCGLCGIASDGCQVVFAAQVSTGGSPGLPARIIATENGGGVFITRSVTSLTPTEDIDAIACVGTRLVVVSQDSGSLHYATISNILDSNETWVEMTTGFVAPAGAPRDIFALGPTQVWIVGAGGYVYKATDVTASVTVQSAGSVTTQPLNAIHGSDALNLVAVGDSNAVIYTRNGGLTWASVTGPAAGVNLNTVWVRSQLEWFVGTAGGRLYYTRDGGSSWTEKSFPGSGAGSVRDIVFSTRTVGYMAHNTTAPAGRILRTIDGGGSWYIAPEGLGNIPANDYVGALAACADPNVIYGGGLADNAVDGFYVKGA